MRVQTTTTTTRFRPKRTARLVVLALGICTLAIPASATAYSDYTTVNALGGDASESSQPAGGSDYSSVNSIAPPASEPGSSGSQGVDSGYSSVNAISGSPADAPTFVSAAPGTDEGFDVPSALVGAGAALALAALGTAALLTTRRRTTISPSAATS